MGESKTRPLGFSHWFQVDTPQELETHWTDLGLIEIRRQSFGPSATHGDGFPHPRINSENKYI